MAVGVIAFLKNRNTPVQNACRGVLCDCCANRPLNLAAQTEALNQITIALYVFLLDIVKQGTALVDQLQQTTT